MESKRSGLQRTHVRHPGLGRDPGNVQREEQSNCVEAVPHRPHSTDFGSSWMAAAAAMTVKRRVPGTVAPSTTPWPPSEAAIQGNKRRCLNVGLWMAGSSPAMECGEDWDDTHDESEAAYASVTSAWNWLLTNVGLTYPARIVKSPKCSPSWRSFA